MLMERMVPAGQWFILVVSSLILGIIFQTFHVPAALLLGPMIVGVVMGLLGASVRIHPLFFKISQGILGCMIAQSLSPSILPPLLNDWPYAAARLKLSTLGFFQYLGPTLMFLLAVVFYGETVNTSQLITFGFIWVGLLCFIGDALYTQGRLRRGRSGHSTA